jgi:hypothetical protein
MLSAAVSVRFFRLVRQASTTVASVTTPATQQPLGKTSRRSRGVGDNGGMDDDGAVRIERSLTALRASGRIARPTVYLRSANARG